MTTPVPPIRREWLPEDRSKLDTSSVTVEATYDPQAGNVTIFDGFVREVIEVRAKIADEILREALIAELRKLGYIVYPTYTPGEEER